MDKQESQKLNEVRKVRTFEVACKECNAITLDEFERRFTKRLKG